MEKQGNNGDNNGSIIVCQYMERLDKRKMNELWTEVVQWTIRNKYTEVSINRIVSGIIIMSVQFVLNKKL